MTTRQQEAVNGGMSTTNVDALIVGAGFAGLYQAHRLRALGVSAQIIEAGDDVGGTWYWNRYPGARCDVESLEYQYGWDEDLPKEWHWSERYATQAEILKYINYVADKLELRPLIQFETRVTKAIFDEKADRWLVETDKGGRFSAKYCIMATGCLSAPRTPDFKGLDSFKGDWYHTAYWPHEGVDFTGKRVGIIGTGSSAIQAIPIIAAEAAHLTVFQRTANFVVPAHNEVMDPEFKKHAIDNYMERRREARKSLSGILAMGASDKSALEVTDEERRRSSSGAGRWAASRSSARSTT